MYLYATLVVLLVTRRDESSIAPSCLPPVQTASKMKEVPIFDETEPR